MLRDRLLRRSEAAQLRWSDVELREDGAGLVHIPQSKTDQEAEGTVLYIGRADAEALQAIMPEGEALDPQHTGFPDWQAGRPAGGCRPRPMRGPR